MKRSASRTSRTVFSTQGDAWTTLGDQLRQKYPELAEKVARFQESDQVVGRLVDQVSDLFPYAWRNPTRFHEGMMLMIRGHNVAALGVFTELCEEDPEAYLAHYFLGYVCGSMGQHKQEVECYRRALRLRPEFPQPQLDLGCALWSLGNEAKAYEAMKRAVSLARDFPLLDYWLTFASDNLGRYLDIYGNEDKAQAEKARDISRAYYLMGNAFMEYGLNAAARQAFKNAVRVDPEYAQAYYRLGALHIKKLRNSKRSAKYLKQAEKLFARNNEAVQAALTHQLAHPGEKPSDAARAAQLWLQEGLRLHKLGLYQAAVDAYKMAIKFQPVFRDAYYNMGIAYGSLEEQGLDTLERAIGAFKHAIRLDTEFIHAYIALGAAYLRRGENQQAVDLLEQAALLDPDNPNLFYYLGTAYRMTRQFDQAVRVLERAVQKAPDSVHAQFNLGLALMDGERYEEAEQALRDSLRIKPDLADAHYLLGQLYCTQLPDAERAQYHLRKCQKLYLKLKDYDKADRIRALLAQQAPG